MTAPSPAYFDANATGYATHRPTYPPQLVQALAQLCPSTHLAWDAGCGSGQLSALLGQVFTQVVATDSSAAQVSQAKPGANITYHAVAAEQDTALAGLQPATVDLSVAAQAAHWFDMDAYNQQVQRVSKPNAIVALVTYGIMVVEHEAVNQTIREFYFGPLAGYWPAQRKHVENNYADLAFPFAPVPQAQALFEHMQIEREWTLEALIGYIHTWSAIDQMRKARQDALIHGFEQQLSRAWPAGAALQVAWPLTVRVGRVNPQ